MTRTAALAAFLAIAGAPAAAQETVAPRVTAEAVLSGAMLSSYKTVSVVLDVTGTARLGDSTTVIVRPWAWHRPNGTTTFQMYQLQVRYVSRTERPFRVDAGVITSPIGLNPLQNRADLNPLITAVPYYVIPLPRFERTFESLQPLTSGYPLGVIVSTSGTRWDLRGGMLDTTPARPGVELKHDGYKAQPQVVLGGGVTLRPGLRVGTAFAHGRYRDGDGTAVNGTATVANLEAEFTINHTRLAAEYVVDRFDGATAVTARSFYVQGMQTITPRIFAAGRISRAKTPPVFGVNRPTSWATAETSGGFRLTPDWTVRAGYVAQRAYFGVWDHQGAVSIVWDARWFR